MILVFVSMMLGTVMGQTSYPNSIGKHSSPSLFNIIDGHIPFTLSDVKGCKRDLQLSNVKPSVYVPITCADIRYSVYDDHMFTLSKNEVSVQRKYTDRLSVSDNGVCKIRVSDMPDQITFELYENEKLHSFLNRYGYCDDNTMGDPILLPGISNVSISCGDEDKDHILTKTECSVTLGYDVEEIYDSNKPYGCVDGKFNSFDRSKDFEDVHPVITARMGQRVQELIDEFDSIKADLNNATISDVPERYPYEPDVNSETGSAYEKLKARLHNIREYIKSVHLKQSYYNSLVNYVTQQQAVMKTSTDNYNRAVEIKNILEKYNEFNLDFVLPDTTNVKADIERLENKYRIIYQNATDIHKDLNMNEERTELQILVGGSSDVDGTYTVYKNYMDEHYHRDRSTRVGLWEWCNSLEEHGEITKSIGCIPNLDFDLHCIPDGAIYRYTEPTAKYDSYGNVYYTDIGTCTNLRPGGSITNCPVACDPDRTQNTIGKNYSHIEWNSPKSNRTAFDLLSKNVIMEKVGLVANTSMEQKLVCPYNYLCTQDFSYEIYEKQITETLWVDNQPTDQFTYRYEYGIKYDLQTSLTDYESVMRAVDCAPYCFAELPTLTNDEPEKPSFSLTTREPTKRKANADIIFQDILTLEKSDDDHSLYDLYRELVEQNLSCESIGCEESCVKPMYNSVEDAVLSCSEMCVFHEGFSQYWDDSPVRQTSRIISNRRHECRCGYPKTELECVMSNNEWVSDIYTTQYSYVPKNPVKRKPVSYSDRYLFCPISHCTDGVVDQRCKKHSYLDCDIGTVCSDVTARMIVNGSPRSFKTNAYHMSEGQFLFGYNVYSGERIGGVVTNLDGDILSTGIVGSFSPTLDMWDAREESGDWTFSITDFSVDFEDSTDACEVGHWYEKSLFRDGCIAPGDTPFCKNGFVDEVCMCKDVSCEPGYYCTKKGECNPWVSKDKKVLHTRYKYLSQQ